VYKTPFPIPLFKMSHFIRNQPDPPVPVGQSKPDSPELFKKSDPLLVNETTIVGAVQKQTPRVALHPVTLRLVVLTII
jgi:hypothetical protein